MDAPELCNVCIFAHYTVVVDLDTRPNDNLTVFQKRYIQLLEISKIGRNFRSAGLTANRYDVL